MLDVLGGLPGQMDRRPGQFTPLGGLRLDAKGVGNSLKEQFLEFALAHPGIPSLP
jgi:hypothetical protein